MKILIGLNLQEDDTGDNLNAAPSIFYIIDMIFC